MPDFQSTNKQFGVRRLSYSKIHKSNCSQPQVNSIISPSLKLDTKPLTDMFKNEKKNLTYGICWRLEIFMKWFSMFNNDEQYPY